MPFVLDTDHMTVLERGGATALALTLRLEAVPEDEVVTTIIKYEEQTKGWLARTAQARTEAAQIEAYRQLFVNFQIYCGLTLLQFDEAASAHFVQLKAAKVRVGTQDLKIASIALANDATVLTRNTRDFSKVPGLKVEDWTI